MKKLKGRTASVLVLTLLTVLGMAVFLVRLMTDGAKWASSRVNGSLWTSGQMTVGTVVDREGKTIIKLTPEGTVYGDDAAVREALLHTTGDGTGNISATAPELYRELLSGYDPVTGINGDGGTVTMSLSAELCADGYKALEGRRGAVAVMDYKTGEILCMTSAPGYDPTVGSSLTADDTSGVYLNRFFSGLYTPGSVFKLVTLAEAIETIPDLEDRVFDCAGSWQVGEGRITCTREHGKLKIDDALALSCNCVFSQLACELGADAIYERAESLGLLTKHNIDGASTAAGRYDKADNNTLMLAWSGVGQYNDMVNPAAMLRFTAAIASGGVAPEMTLLKGNTGGGERIISEATADRIAEMMDYCVHKTYGEENFPDLELAAKSGTAEVGGDLKPHSWFVGFSRREDMPLCFIVVIENGGWGSAEAGSAAAAIMKTACDIYTEADDGPQ